MQVIAPLLLALAGVVAAAIATPAAAGTEYEFEVSDRRLSRIGVEWLRVEGSKLRLDRAARGRQDPGRALIFSAERAQPRLIVVDREGGHVIVDQEAIARLAAEGRSGPEDATIETSDLEYVELGLREMAGYPCTSYEVTRGGTKLQEVCVTDWANVDGARRTRETIEAFGEFYGDLLTSLAGMPGAGQAILGRADNPAEHVLRLDLFPVTTDDYENGELVRRSVLRSVREVEHPPGAFELDPSSVERPFG